MNIAAAPTPVAGGLTFTSISVGADAVCATSTTGNSTAQCWGVNRSGALGQPTSTAQSAVPLPVSGGLKFVSVGIGSEHACGLAPAVTDPRFYRAYCWGSGPALGDGVNVDTSVPVRVAGNLFFASLAVGRSFTCGITDRGIAYCWGINFYGMLGNGTTTPSSTPVRVLNP